MRRAFFDHDDDCPRLKHRISLNQNTAFSSWSCLPRYLGTPLRTAHGTKETRRADRVERVASSLQCSSPRLYLYTIGTAAGRSGGCKSHRWTRPASPSPPSRRFDVVGTKHLSSSAIRGLFTMTQLFSPLRSLLSALCSLLSLLSPLFAPSPLFSLESALASRAPADPSSVAAHRTLSEPGG